jgi:hypothetical protein
VFHHHGQHHYAIELSVEEQHELEGVKMTALHFADEQFATLMFAAPSS